MLVVVTISSRLGSAGTASTGLTDSLVFFVTSLLGLALEMRSLDIRLRDDLEDFDFVGLSFRLFGFFSATRLSQGSEENKTHPKK